MLSKITDAVFAAAAIGAQEAYDESQKPGWLESDARAAIVAAHPSGQRAARALDLLHFTGRGIERAEAAVLADISARSADETAQRFAVLTATRPTPLRAISVVDAVVDALAENPATTLSSLSQSVNVDADRLRRLLGPALVALIHDPATGLYEHTTATRYSDTDMFDAIREVAVANGTPDTVPLAVYRAAQREHPGVRPSSAGILRRFGTWDEALEGAGLTVPRKSGRTHYERRFDAEGVTAAVARFILANAGRRSAHEYDRWASGRDDVPRSIGIAARPRKWREVVADAFDLIGSDLALADGHRAAVKAALSGRTDEAAA